MSPDAAAKEGPRIMPFPVALHYEAPAAPALTRYAEALVDGKIIGQQCTGDCGLVYVPPRDLCPIDVIELGTDDDVVLGDKGIVTNFTIVTPVQYYGQEKTEPFAKASIMLRRPGRHAQPPGHPRDPARGGARRHAGGSGVAARERAQHRRYRNRWWGSTAGAIVGWRPTGEPDLPAETFLEKVY